MAGDAG
ncbi:transcriptional regulator, LuxR family, partial [Bordetella hinzii L60]